jgi:hypothetical protein
MKIKLEKIESVSVRRADVVGRERDGSIVLSGWWWWGSEGRKKSANLFVGSMTSGVHVSNLIAHTQSTQ